MLFDLLQMNLISVVINHLSIEYEINSNFTRSLLLKIFNKQHPSFYHMKRQICIELKNNINISNK